MSALPRRLLRAEGLALLVGAVALYSHLGYGWLAFALLVLVPDLSLAGYLAGPRAGALAYDLAHTEVWAVALAVGGTLGGVDALVQVGLIWLAHIGVDRLVGYGLKYPTDPKHTHLQRV